MIKRLSIQRIRRDFQSSEYLIDFVVDQYILDITSRKKIQPVQVYYDGDVYWLADGFHRVEAALKCGRRMIMAEIRPGTYADIQAEHQRMMEAIRQDLQSNPLRSPRG